MGLYRGRLLGFSQYHSNRGYGKTRSRDMFDHLPIESRHRHVVRIHFSRRTTLIHKDSRCFLRDCRGVALHAETRLRLKITNQNDCLVSDRNGGARQYIAGGNGNIIQIRTFRRCRTTRDPRANRRMVDIRRNSLRSTARTKKIDCGIAQPENSSIRSAFRVADLRNNLLYGGGAQKRRSQHRSTNIADEFHHHGYFGSVRIERVFDLPQIPRYRIRHTLHHPDEPG